MSSRKIYDVSPVEREVAEFRAARQNKLRLEYHKQVRNPYLHSNNPHGEQMEEIAINRWTAMRATAYHFFKPTYKGGLFFFGTALLPIVLLTMITSKQRDDKERIYRTGQISYYDREPKFI